MIFAMTWTLSGIPPGYTVTKRSDRNNRNMYLTDNLGNRYDHIGGDETAYSSIPVSDGLTLSGWFDFGAPPVDAFVFTFHDDDNGILINGLGLYAGSSAPAIQFADYELDAYPRLILRFQEGVWQRAITPENVIVLSNKNMPTCTVRALAPSEPRGEYKSTVAIGEITYSIYGYFDEGMQLFVREYIYESGLAGVEPGLKPFLYVTIPGDRSYDCILDASGVFSGLVLKSP